MGRRSRNRRKRANQDIHHPSHEASGESPPPASQPAAGGPFPAEGERIRGGIIGHVLRIVPSLIARARGGYNVDEVRVSVLDVVEAAAHVRVASGQISDTENAAWNAVYQTIEDSEDGFTEAEAQTILGHLVDIIETLDASELFDLAQLAVARIPGLDESQSVTIANGIGMVRDWAAMSSPANELADRQTARERLQDQLSALHNHLQTLVDVYASDNGLGASDDGEEQEQGE